MSLNPIFNEVYALFRNVDQKVAIKGESMLKSCVETKIDDKEGFFRCCQESNKKTENYENDMNALLLYVNKRIQSAEESGEDQVSLNRSLSKKVQFASRRIENKYV